jgi:NADH:ubiquinone oxidoreductase subunit 6 (subunit J)
MNPSQLENLLGTLVKKHLLQSVMIWGAPGIGKSHTVAAVAQAAKIDLVDLRISQLAPTDLRGLPSRLGAGLVGLALLANLLVMQRQKLPALVSAPASDNVVEPVASSLFTDYLVAFELTSLVLLVAVVGAVLLAKRRAQA